MIVLLAVAVFFGSIPLVLAAETKGCACCQSSCDCKATICHTGCTPAPAITKAHVTPDQPKVGAFSHVLSFTYEHKPLHTVFHPPNTDSAVLS